MLAAHTQKEEQVFLNRFKQLRGIQTFKADYLEKQKGQATCEGEENIFWACSSVLFSCQLVKVRLSSDAFSKAVLQLVQLKICVS